MKRITMPRPAHPGQFIRMEVIEPLGLSVTDAAKVLGVTRPALSALLNGRAALSPDMAIRIEKAFGPKGEIKVKRYVAKPTTAHAALCKDRGPQPCLPGNVRISWPHAPDLPLHTDSAMARVPTGVATTRRRRPALQSGQPLCKDIIVTTPDEIARRGDLAGSVLRPPTLRAPGGRYMKLVTRSRSKLFQIFSFRIQRRPAIKHGRPGGVSAPVRLCCHKRGQYGPTTQQDQA
jgi:addiction module HigA family antidote